MKQSLLSKMGKKVATAMFASALVFTASQASAQSGVGINSTGSPANNSAGLDVDFSNKGVLIPRIALSGVSDVSTIPSPANSLLVFNTTNGAGLTPGFYYFDATLNQWTAVGGSGGGGGGFTVACGSPQEDMTLVRNNGQWECNDVLEVDPTWNAVSINNFSGPSSSYNLLVSGNVGIDGLGTPSSSFDLSVGGDTHISDRLSVGTTTSAPTSGILSAGDVKLNSSSSSFVVGSTNITGSGSSYINTGLSVGTTSSPPSSGLRVSGTAVLAGQSSQTGTSSSYYFVIQNSSGQLYRGNATNFYTSSSKYFKKDIADLKVDKSKLLSLQPKSYRYKENFGGNSNIGLIAEEVAALVPELATYGPKRIVDANGDVMFDEEGKEMVDETQIMPDGVNYDRLGVYLLPVVAEHEETIKTQNAEIAELKAAIARQEAMIARLVEALPKEDKVVSAPDNTLRTEVLPEKK